MFLQTKNVQIKWQAHQSSSSVLTLKSISPNQLVSLGRNDYLKLWHLSLPGDVTKAASPMKPVDAPNGSDEQNILEKGRIKVVCSHKVMFKTNSGFVGCDVFKQFGVVVAAVPGSNSADVVSVWKLNAEMKMVELSVNEASKVQSVMCLKWIEKNHVVALLVAYESGDMCVWDWCNKNIHSTSCVKDNPVCLEYDHSTHNGVIGTVSEKVYPFTVGANFQLTVMRFISMTNEGIGATVTRPDGKLYVTGGWDNLIRVFTWQKNKQLAVLKAHKSSISSVHFSPSKITSVEANLKEEPNILSSPHYLAAGSTDSIVSVWKIY